MKTETVEMFKVFLAAFVKGIDEGDIGDKNGHLRCTADDLRDALDKEAKRAKVFWHPGRLRKSVQIVGEPLSQERLAKVETELNVLMDLNKEIEKLERMIRKG